MATRVFRSELAPYIQSFIETRKAFGRSDIWTAKLLYQFDEFSRGEIGHGQTITKDLLDRYIQSMSHLSAGTIGNRVSALRNFCIYLRCFDNRTCLVTDKLVPMRTRHLPHIYSQSEIRVIMNAAKKIGPQNSLRPALFYTLVGLLASTGLRIGEAIRLTLGDVDVRHRVILVNMTKFKKTRYVPISQSVAQSLAIYMGRRKKAGFSQEPRSPFFVNSQKRKYGHARITEILLGIMRSTGIRGPKGEKGPRIHDFRHTFAVRRLLSWYRQGDNVMAKLPLLSTYMGHLSMASTELYLHATSELLEQVGNRFHRNFSIPVSAEEVADENRN
jgi:integrase/recombinase XerD